MFLQGTCLSSHIDFSLLCGLLAFVWSFQTHLILILLREKALRLREVLLHENAFRFLLTLSLNVRVYVELPEYSLWNKTVCAPR
jgi:hypothetical protein